MATYKLTITYDGRSFLGWQKQKNRKTVQDAIEIALSKIFKQDISIIGSGRTDTGVHALAQCAHFSTSILLQSQTIKKAVNAHLPRTIRITHCTKTKQSFHARYSAQGKWYRYYIYNKKYPSVFDHYTSTHIPYKLNISAMKKAAQVISGTHDYTWLISSKDKNKIRTVYITVKKNHEFIVIDVIGTGFLYKMVRRICGALVESGNGRLTIKKLTSAIKTGQELNIPTLSACGLFLVKVYY